MLNGIWEAHSNFILILLAHMVVSKGENTWAAIEYTHKHRKEAKQTREASKQARKAK
jgi:hypothetical protein